MTNLTKEELDVIKSTIPLLKERGVEVTKYFYEYMFENYPQVKPMFDQNKQKSGEQPKALALAVLNAGLNLEDLSKIQNQVNKIGQKHVSLGVKPEHYPIVGECLLEAIKVVLGAGQDILDVWGKAYGEIAQYYIGVEKEIYASQEG